MILSLMLLLSFAGISQTFDSLQFRKNLDRAQWIQEYDWAVGMAVEELMEEDLAVLSKILEPPFYCKRLADSVWIFSIGKASSTGFQPVYQFRIDKEIVRRMDSAVERENLNAFHRAYQHSRIPLDSILEEGGPRFRTYFDTDSAGHIHVWSIPAPDIFAPALFGAEFYHEYEPNGLSLLRSSRTLLPSFLHIVRTEPTGVELPYPQLEVPNIETICYVLDHQDLFGTIRIATKNWVSFLEEDGITWIHEFRPVEE